MPIENIFLQKVMLLQKNIFSQYIYAYNMGVMIFA